MNQNSIIKFCAVVVFGVCASVINYLVAANTVFSLGFNLLICGVLPIYIIWQTGTFHSLFLSFLSLLGLVMATSNPLMVWQFAAYCIVWHTILGLGMSLMKSVTANRNLSEFLNMAYECAYDGIWHLTDVKSNEMWWSDRFREIIGDTLQPMDDNFENFVSLINPDDLRKFEDAWYDLLHHQKLEDLELRFKSVRHKDYFWVHMRCRRFKYQDGRIAVVGSINSIHELKKTQEELRFTTAHLEDIVKERMQEIKEQQRQLLQSEQRFRTFIEYTYNLEYWLGKDGELVYMSPRSCELITGYSSSNFMEEPGMFASIVHPDDRELFEEHSCCHTSDSPEQNYELRIITKSGKVEWLSHNCHSVFDDRGNFIGRRISERPITSEVEERQAKQAALNEINAILDNSLIGIALVVDNKIVRANNGMINILGYSKEEVLGMSLMEFLSSEDEYFRFDKMCIESLKHGPIHDEWRFKHKDGWYIWCNYYAKAVNSKNFEEGVVWVLEDITSRRKAQEDLKCAMQDLKDASEYKNRFIANMSHDFRTPLHSILGYSDFLKSELSSPHHLEYLGSIRRSCNIMLELVNDILDISSVEARRISIEKHYFSLKLFLNDLLAIFQPQASQNSVNLILKYDDDIPSAIYLDEKRLRQVMINLLSNAVKFTHGGKVVVEVIMQRKSAESIDVTIAVADNGIGIDNSKHEDIFRPFDQAGEDIHERFGGSGLGLAICQKLMELMDGRIELISDVGKGSRFELIFDKVLYRKSMSEQALPLFEESEDEDYLEFIINEDELMVDAENISRILDEKILPVYEQESNGFDFDKIKQLGIEIMEAGNEWNQSSIRKIGDEICQAAVNFDTRTLRSKLKEVDTLINCFKNISNKRN